MTKKTVEAHQLTYFIFFTNDYIHCMLLYFPIFSTICITWTLFLCSIPGFYKFSNVHCRPNLGQNAY